MRLNLSALIVGIFPLYVSAKFIHQVTDDSLPNHKLSVNDGAESLGVDTVKQYTGYLDVEPGDKHFFYWFFESRNDPTNDPIVLWLTGGPGCSSLTALFAENGPSSVDDNTNLVRNPYSWNNNASVIYLDQPVNTGFSYSSESVGTTAAAAIDVYAFLQLFFKQYPQYSTLKFTVVGESYGGHYVPAVAAEILSQTGRNFNLTSIAVGNGLTDPLTQYSYYEPMACGQGGYPSVLSSSDCSSMQSSLSSCTQLIQSCYSNPQAFECSMAEDACNESQLGPYDQTGLNDYDIRGPCEVGGTACYQKVANAGNYLDQPFVVEAIGAQGNWTECSNSVYDDFSSSGDWMLPFQQDVASTLAAGVPVLIYAGDKDFICNWLGNHAWSDALSWTGHTQFQAQSLREWTGSNGNLTGQVKSYDNFTFLRVYDAGHLVPHDQPSNALSFINTWLSGDYGFS